MLEEVSRVAKDFLEFSKGKPVRVISHFDTDGITSAAILAKTFSRLDINFSLRTVKGLTEEILSEELSRNSTEILIFSDLASNSLEHFSNLKNPIFILDHHEIHKDKLNDKIRIINPHLTSDPEGNACSGAGICYLFSKAISSPNIDLAKIAIIGMIGDRHETNLSRIGQLIINDASELEIRKGLVLYPATRPLRRALEYSSSPYIPGVTGNGIGASDLLRDAGIPFDKSLLDLSDDEMSKLLTAVMLRRAGSSSSEDIVGNLFILKFFNTREDVREISVLINACSRLGESDTAILYCLEVPGANVRAMDLYSRYKQELVSGLRVAEKLDKIDGDGFVILNAKDKIKDVIVGTICSMLSSSPSYKQGTVLIGMAYNEDKIKVSARIVGREGRNLKEVLERTVISFKSDHPDSSVEVGGHHFAAGCLIEREKEEHFIDILKKNLEVEVVKV